MNNIKKDYKKIFEEYCELEAKTFIPAKDLNDGKIKGVDVKPEDLFRVDELREELKKGLEILTDDQLKFLSNDDDTALAIGAVKVLTERRLKNNC